MNETKCTICGTTKSEGWMTQAGYTLCIKCYKDISDFEFQPNPYHNYKMLAEVFFRRGKGEEITFEELYKQKSDFKFISFTDLFEMKEKNE